MTPAQALAFAALLCHELATTARLAKRPEQANEAAHAAAVLRRLREELSNIAVSNLNGSQATTTAPRGN